MFHGRKKVILVLKDMKGSKHLSNLLLFCCIARFFPTGFKHKPFLFSYSHFGAENMPKSVQFTLRLTNHCVCLFIPSVLSWKTAVFLTSNRTEKRELDFILCTPVVSLLSLHV